ncbi:hypothetical protein TWF718_002565 [Orbilia javanica]|uniref:Uncharacterized protein n=1 Tax=Orbilia javanica TaxID=47235 RepID=A0AAN8RA08_9PEZI
MQYKNTTSYRGLLLLFLFFYSSIPVAFAAPGAGEGYINPRSSLPKPGVSLPSKTSTEIAPTTGLEELTPETTAVTKTHKSKKKEKVKVVTVVHSVPITATIVKRTDIMEIDSGFGDYPTPPEDEEYETLGFHNTDWMDTEEPHQTSKTPKTLLSEDENTTVSVLQVVVPTDRPIIVTTYACQSSKPLPSDTPLLAKKLIEMKSTAVSCIKPSSDLEPDLASQTSIMEYVEKHFCSTVLGRADDGSGIVHTVREVNGAMQQMSAVWVVSGKKPVKQTCIEAMKSIWEKCGDIEGQEAFRGGKALLKEGVFFNLEAVVPVPVKGGKRKASG